MTRPFEKLSVQQVARFPRPGMVVPGRVEFTPGSDAITYLYSEEGSLARGLWRYDLATGERTLLAGPPPKQQFSREEELRRERLRLREEGVTDYAFATHAAEGTLLLPSPGGLRISVGGGAFEDIPDTAGVLDPRLSPDGTKAAFVRGNDLYVADCANGEQTRLTYDGAEGITNGLAEFIAAEELDRDRGFWWSPDGTRIAYIRADSRHITTYPIVHQGLAKVDVENHQYPFAGEANATLRLGVVAATGGETAWMDLGPDTDIYIARVNWRPDGVLTAQVLSRGQQDLALAAFDPEGTRIVLHEHSEPWYNLHSDLRFLKDGTFLWSTEASGYRHLQLRAAGGQAIRDLTSGPWVVTSVVGVDEERRLVYFSGTRESPVERHVYRVSFDGGEAERLTYGQGMHGASLAKDGSRLLVLQSSLEYAPSYEIVDLATGQRTPFFEQRDISAEALGLSGPEVVSFPAKDGTALYGMVYSPPRREPGRRYPIVVSVYGGPHAQRVVRDWSSTVDLRAQYLAQQGFIVLKVDNRGSANRGLSFEAHLDRLTGAVEVEDQAAGVAWLAANYHYADPAGAAIYGWSYGGYMTLMAMAKRPDVFTVGVAGAPVTHWDGYDTAYTERYMGTPAENPDGYEQSSVMAHLDGLSGDLLVVHGMVDENVHFRHTGRLLVEMAKRGKTCAVLIYPEERHMPRDAKGLEDQERKVLDFIIDRLRGR